MQTDREMIRRLAERKLRQQIVRHDRDLRQIVGHFEVLDHVNEDLLSTPDAAAPMFGSPLQRHGAPTKRATPVSAESPREEDKRGAVTTCVEVEVEDEDGSSDEDSIEGEDDVLEPGEGLVRMQSHAPPMIVGDEVDGIDKRSAYMVFQETVYEVLDDD